MVYDILSNEKRKFRLHENERKVMARRYHLRQVDEAKSHNVKMKAIGFDNKTKRSGIGAYYCFRADPLLGPRIAARRFYCSCAFCMNKLSLPTIEERYDGPFDQCKYWPLFRIDDHRGWNDVRIISFEPAKGCDVNELEETFVATLRELGKTMARSVVIGGKGAYSVDAEDSKYYLVEWTADPHMIEEDNVIMVVDQPMQLFAGDWVCCEKWLNPVHRAKYWYMVGDVEVTIRM